MSVPIAVPTPLAFNVPPAFSDIGKTTNDLLNKDFPLGAAKLEVNTFTNNGVKFTVLGAKDNKTGAIASELKAKHIDKARGVTFTESWTSSNILGTQLELDNTLARGLKVDVAASLLPAKGTKNLKAGVEYKQDHLFTRAFVDLFRGPALHADAVVANDGFLAGGEVAYDISEARLTRSNLAFGYLAREYTVALHASNALNTFAASYYHRVNTDVEAGAKATWTRSTDNDVHVEVGTKYFLDNEAFVKAKIDNRGLLGLGYTHLLRKGVKLSLGGLFDTTRFHENTHKLGLALTLEA
ncbi:eukaryotic porin/Tom40 [Fimicolochytrium jonesii]|uniref:eukaryotic porin/Tom40 n=1 Tax=Fimicolochytrium jonesii TaxID=1396493 RepID=UPI0022FF2B1A|nr:eukaryotic porin/Tom40 [Fimicolochytrium jonesii]KAI8820833.1 eukaryotic porin/Tom40 [Fimicolochytrium jonesii]